MKMLADLKPEDMRIDNEAVLHATDFELLTLDKGLSEFLSTYLEDAAWGMPTPKNPMHEHLARMTGKPAPTTRPRWQVVMTFEALLRVRDERARRAEIETAEEERQSNERMKAKVVAELRKMAAQVRTAAAASAEATSDQDLARAAYLEDQAAQVEAGTIRWDQARTSGEQTTPPGVLVN